MYRYLLKIIAVPFFLFLSACQTTGLNQQSYKYQQGDIVEGNIGIGKDRLIVPLPPGKWEVASTLSRFEGSSGRSQYVDELIGLIQVENDVVIRRLSLRSNQTAAENGFPNYSGCNPQAVSHYQEINDDYTRLNQDCLWIRLVLPIKGTNQKKYEGYFRSINEYIKSNNYLIPGVFIASGHRVADNNYHLVAINLFNPENDGFGTVQSTDWEKSSWHPNNIKNDQAKLKYLERVKDWSKRYHRKVKSGWHGDLTYGKIEADLALDNKALAQERNSEISEIEKRLLLLKSMYEEKLITKDEYVTKRQSILADL